ncbi:MAG: riboflavin biosynthesis protein RibF [Planctomycetes bacterium]|nr:riboflavin biosynthesis protein RibF [Planctomycetota bacterium]
MTQRRSVITVGNFDGVHRGHAALISRARQLADAAGAQVVVVSFTRHPLTELRPEASPPTLMDRPQREAALREAGADVIDWLEPDMRTVLSLTPRAFVEKMVSKFAPQAWVEGGNFRFGRKREGDVRLLKELGAEMGFDVHIVDRVAATLRDKTIVPISSSLVRFLVACGRVADAQICLGRPFVMRGRVIEGEKRGRTIGFPTANIDTADRVLPADGVYGGTIDLDGRTFPVAISVGVKPTFGKRDRAFEVYIMGDVGDLYDRVLEIRVLRFLRDQAVFTSVEPLVEQMQRDVRSVQAMYDANLLCASELAVGKI